MQSTATRNRFIELRAQDWSLARIADHLGVAKRTLVAWNQRGTVRVPLRSSAVKPSRPPFKFPVSGFWFDSVPVHPRYFVSPRVSAVTASAARSLRSSAVGFVPTANSSENCTVSAPFLHQKQCFFENAPCPSTTCGKIALTWCNFETATNWTVNTFPSQNLREGKATGDFPGARPNLADKYAKTRQNVTNRAIAPARFRSVCGRINGPILDRFSQGKQTVKRSCRPMAVRGREHEFVPHPSCIGAFARQLGAIFRADHISPRRIENR